MLVHLFKEVQEPFTLILAILCNYIIGYFSAVFYANQEDTFDQKCISDSGPTIIGERSVKTQLRSDPDSN